MAAAFGGAETIIFGPTDGLHAPPISVRPKVLAFGCDEGMKVWQGGLTQKERSQQAESCAKPTNAAL